MALTRTMVPAPVPTPDPVPNSDRERDRFIDGLRAFSILAVIFGHWTMAVPSWDGQSFKTTSILAIVDELWIFTWLFQVVPLFFFAGGYSNALTLRRHRPSYAQFVNRRARRLLTPTLVLLAIWTAISLVLAAAGLEAGLIRKLTVTITQPLWFIAVYLLITALALNC